ncbi:scarecrow-like protein 8 [Phragmites australis]|uniref:scarecrow-like protein 8 n=1 Tax=Phragmites australis TaxID=29695 RepID=UPI002D76BB11|nr:scarecrow-like protein 8 [Phragmites australis]
MEPAGAPWCDPRRGYGYGYGGGSAVEAPSMRGQQQQQPPPRPDAASVASGGVLKRSLSKMERWQQALYLRSVRQRVAAQPAHTPLDIRAVLAGAASRASGFSGPPSAGFAGLSPQPSSTYSSLTTASPVATPPPMQVQQLVQRQMMAAPSAQAVQAVARGAGARPATAKELMLLQELEKQLLCDDDEEEADAAGSACGSTVTNSAWGDTIQELNSITAAPSASLPLASAMNNNYNSVPMSRSPTNSSSSTASSTASSSPPTTAASSRQLLCEAAAAVADGNHTTAAAHLAVLKVAAAPRGDAKQRLVAMMADALSSRLAAPSSQHLVALCSAEQRTACQLLHDVSPCFGLALHGANLAILDAVADHRAIHLVDFDVSVAQHIALIHALANRRVAGTSLKVTAVADPTSPFTPALAQELTATGEQLKKHAQQAGVEFWFKAVSCRAGDIEASRLKCEPGEALAVNLAFSLSRIPDESVSPANPRDKLLRRVRALGPRVVTLVEQELNTNTAPLAARFSDACAHYGAVLESLDATLGRDSAQRVRAEVALANKVANAVAREGPDRVERCEVFGKWRARFGMAGFRPVAIGQSVSDRVNARLGPALPGFDVKLDNGRLGVGWMGRLVTVASAWR